MEEDNNLFEPALALAIMVYGKDGEISIPKTVVDMFVGVQYRVEYFVDEEKEELKFRVLIIDKERAN